LADYARRANLPSVEQIRPDNALVGFSENLLAGAIGASSARVMVASVVKEEPLGMDDVLHILDEASQVIAYSHELEQKSRALELATTELRAANARLQELDRLKDDFISTVTHELRTPLTSIRAMAEILQSRPDLDATRRANFVAVIVKESERLTRLINQVLDLAKLESGAADWHSGDVDLRALIEDAAASTAAVLRERAVQLTLNIPGDVPTVRSDRDRLMQVLLNLLSNAAKFCEPGKGRITIDLRVRPGELQVDVADNGIGIEPADQSSIFEKFRQVGDTLTDKPQGTGLGLPISREIIQRLGGRLWVDSTPGMGARFSFSLPRDVPPAAAEHATAVDGASR
jgi:signal transduction histidine kinase